jgi:DNA polymerase III delta subunit
LTLSDSGAQTLIDLVGEDLHELDGELAKLSLQDDIAGKSVDGDQVTAMVARSRDIDAFTLADLLDAARPAAALDQWFRLRNGGGDIMGCAAILGWRLRQIAQLRAGLDEGHSPHEAAQIAGMAPWQTRRLGPMVDATSSTKIDATISAWRVADRRAKSSSLGAGLAYDMAMLKWAMTP